MLRTIVPLTFFAVVLTGCAEPMLAEQAKLCGETPGFLWGLLHGVIAPFTFLVSLLKEDVAIYAVCNSGGWYDFGFCLGIGAFTKGSHSAGKAAKRKDD